jgi:hypothetical protein
MVLGRDELPSLTPLLTFLSAHLPEPPAVFQRWQITRIHGGQNNLLFRVTLDDRVLAIKFTRRDARDRAGREFAALYALQHIDPTLAPIPLLLDRDTFAYPVVVQSWLVGDCHAAMPETMAHWHFLIQHFQAIHHIRPQQLMHPIPSAVLTMMCAHDGVQRLRQAWQNLPPYAYPEGLHALVQQIVTYPWPVWPQPEYRLCRVDPNILNFIRMPTRWSSVDWENSGWGDPAFEIADLMAHPAYVTVANADWEQIVSLYCQGSTDSTLAIRIHTYRLLQLVDWAIFFARKAAEYAHGTVPPEHFVARPAAWYARLPQQATHYRTTAYHVLQSFAGA